MDRLAISCGTELQSFNSMINTSSINFGFVKIDLGNIVEALKNQPNLRSWLSAEVTNTSEIIVYPSVGKVLFSKPRFIDIFQLERGTSKC